MATPDEIKKLREYYAKNGHIPTLLGNESKARFGEADSKAVGDLGRLVAQGKISKDEAQRRIRQGAAVKNPDTLRAGLDVSAELDPAINSTKRKRTAAKTALDTGNEVDTTRTKQFTTDVAGLYAALQAQLQAQTPQIAANYDQSSTAISGNTSALQEQIRAAYDKANAATAARVAGMQGGTTEAQSQGGQDSAFLQGLAGVQGQSQLGLLAVGKQGALNVDRAGQNYTAWEGTTTQTDALSDLLNRVNARQAEFGAQDTEYAGQLADLEESRFAKVYEGKQSLADARAEAEADAEQRQFERNLAQAKLGIDQQEVDIKRTNTSLAARRVDLDIERFGLDRRKVEIDSRKAEAQLQKEQRAFTPGTLEYLEKEAAINLKRAQAAATLTNAASSKSNAAVNAAKLSQAQAKGKSYGKGIGGAQAYVNDVADPATATLVMKHVNNTMKHFKDYNGGLRGIEGWISKHNPPPEVANAMRRATGIAYGKSS